MKFFSDIFQTYLIIDLIINWNLNWTSMILLSLKIQLDDLRVSNISFMSIKLKMVNINIFFNTKMSLDNSKSEYFLNFFIFEKLNKVLL